MDKSELVFEQVLRESREQEHSDAVMLAKEDYNSWIDLIIWDILEIQNAYKKITETTDLEKYQHCLDTLKEDIEILDNQTSPKIFDVSESNRNLVKLVGFINDTFNVLADQQKQILANMINNMKDTIHNFITETNKGLKGFIWAENIWNKFSPKKKHRILHDLDDRIEKENDSNTVYIKL